DIFDAIEYSYFYVPLINLNVFAEKLARKYNLPMIGTSDAHELDVLETTYSLIDCSELTAEAVFDAIRSNRVKIITHPVSYAAFVSTSLSILWQAVRRGAGKEKR
ncbi:hypothetical protein COY95_03780, partial [Candidatus Woesearchaeota archaeon CG_4_10_14_0_8_um_filter_47_5]